MTEARLNRIDRLARLFIVSIGFCGIVLWAYDRLNYDGDRYFEAATGDFVVRETSLFRNEVLKRQPTILLPKPTHDDVVVSDYGQRHRLIGFSQHRGSGNSALYSLRTNVVGDLAADWSDEFHQRVSDTLWEASDRHDSEAAGRISWTAFESPDDVEKVVSVVREEWRAADATRSGLSGDDRR